MQLTENVIANDRITTTTNWEKVHLDEAPYWTNKTSDRFSWTKVSNDMIASQLGMLSRLFAIHFLFQGCQIFIATKFSNLLLWFFVLVRRCFCFSLSIFFNIFRFAHFLRDSSQVLLTLIEVTIKNYNVICAH